jgi:DNA modification methylase
VTARYIVGDTRAVLASLPDGSVDLVLSSPPFLALRSYLPADHPDKQFEIGSEATPADFLDTLLDIAELCARVLAPHGSLVFELGDTYSGSGGAGGDYNETGYGTGQNAFDGSSRRMRQHNLYAV